MITPPLPALICTTPSSPTDRLIGLGFAVALHVVGGLGIAAWPATETPAAAEAPRIIMVNLVAPTAEPPAAEAPAERPAPPPEPAPAPPQPAPPPPQPAPPPSPPAAAPAQRPAPPDPAPEPPPKPAARATDVAPPAPVVTNAVMPEQIAAVQPVLEPAVWSGNGLSNPPPPYPRTARLRGQEGTVLLQVQVSTQGHVQSAHVLESSGYDTLDRTALTTVRAWRFQAARRDGTAIPGTVQIPVTFRLRG